MNSCLALGIMARPGATWPEYYVVAVILRRPKIRTESMEASPPWRDGICTCDCFHCLWMPDFPLPHLDMPGLGQGSGPGNNGWQNSSWQGGNKMYKFLIQTNIPIFHHSLAQTWHAGPAFHGHHVGNPTATEKFSPQLAPGQAIIPSGLNETCSIKITVITMSYTISETL